MYEWILISAGGSDSKYDPLDEHYCRHDNRRHGSQLAPNSRSAVDMATGCIAQWSIDTGSVEGPMGRRATSVERGEHYCRGADEEACCCCR